MDNQTPTAPVKKPLPLSRKKPYVFNWDRPIKRHPITYMWSIPVADHIVLKSRFEDRVYTGADNVPKEGGFLLCSNHVNGFDPITITVGFRGRREMYFMAKEEFYQAFYTRWALNIWNGFPVNRGKADRDSINYAVRVLKAGFGLLVFPQGTRDLLGERPSGFSSTAQRSLHGKRGSLFFRLPSIRFRNRVIKRRPFTSDTANPLPIGNLASQKAAERRKKFVRQHSLSRNGLHSSGTWKIKHIRRHI